MRRSVGRTGAPASIPKQPGRAARFTDVGATGQIGSRTDLPHCTSRHHVDEAGARDWPQLSEPESLLPDRRPPEPLFASAASHTMWSCESTERRGCGGERRGCGGWWRSVEGGGGPPPSSTILALYVDADFVIAIWPAWMGRDEQHACAAGREPAGEQLRRAAGAERLAEQRL